MSSKNVYCYCHSIFVLLFWIPSDYSYNWIVENPHTEELLILHIGKGKVVDFKLSRVIYGRFYITMSLHVHGRYAYQATEEHLPAGYAHGGENTGQDYISS